MSVMPEPGQGSITKITPGGVQTNFASGLSTPDGLAFNSAGDLFEADNATGNIYEFTPGGARSTFASGLVYPTGLTFNSAGDLFVRNGHSIIEVTPTGAQSTVATGFGTAEGLAFQPVPDLAAIVTNGVFQVTVSMPSPYYSTIVQASTDLVNWVNIYTNTPPFTFAESSTVTGPHFYRALLGQ